MVRARPVLLTALLVTALAGCSLLEQDPSPAVTITTTTSPTPVEPEPIVTVTATPEPDDTYARPLYLGQVPLEMEPFGLGRRGPTPAELEDRRLEPRPWLPSPDSEEFTASIHTVPDDVAARSSWEQQCPVALDDLAYITMTYWGFDQRPHNGEMLIHRDLAEEVVDVFEQIYDARFPIEEMRVISRAERDAHTTGDHNITSGFTCRRVVGAATVWSEHAKGLAVDINPFHNPFIKGEELFPELSEAYLDRAWERPGMINDDSFIVDAFKDLGWTWGGDWTGREDWMHFSAEGG